MGLDSKKTDGLNLAIFISGRGSNMRSLVEACEDPDFPAQVTLVLSNRPDAAGLEFARGKNIPTQVVSHKDFETRESFEEEILDTLKDYDVDLICLAGFMRVLTPHFISHWQDRLINIHPSLLPDYKGLHTHERVLNDKKSESGCTVHFVVPEMDSGPIIVQRRVKVSENDTPDTLAARVLEQEHIAYPEAVRLIAAESAKKDKTAY